MAAPAFTSSQSQQIERSKSSCKWLTLEAPLMTNVAPQLSAGSDETVSTAAQTAKAHRAAADSADAAASSRRRSEDPLRAATPSSATSRDNSESLSCQSLQRNEGALSMPQGTRSSVRAMVVVVPARMAEVIEGVRVHGTCGRIVSRRTRPRAGDEGHREGCQKKLRQREE